MLWQVVAAVALALWFGGGVVAGFVAPQSVFAVLSDRQTAGSLAGLILSRYALLVTVCGGLYIAAWFLTRLTSRPWPRRRLVVVVAALALVVASHWLLTPQIALLRAQMAAPGAPADLAGRFDSLHRLSVALFGIQWLLSGLALVQHSMGSDPRRHFAH
jgi:hypothetical protein